MALHNLDNLQTQGRHQLHLNHLDILNNYGGNACDLRCVLNSEVDDSELLFHSKHSNYFDFNGMKSYLLDIKNNNFSILSLNSQSIRAKFPQIQALIQDLGISNVFLDVICIQESWLDEYTNLDLLHIDDYNMFSLPSHSAAGMVGL